MGVQDFYSMQKMGMVYYYFGAIQTRILGVCYFFTSARFVDCDSCDEHRIATIANTTGYIPMHPLAVTQQQ